MWEEMLAECRILLDTVVVQVNVSDRWQWDPDHSDGCNALSNYLTILLDDMVYVYILYDFDDYVTYL